MKTLLATSIFLLMISGCQLDDRVDLKKDLTVENETNTALRMGNAFPEIIPLPTGFAPEGIVNGNGSEFFVGSLAGGAIYKGDFRTGAGSLLVPQSDKIAVGLDYDERTDYLYVAGYAGVAYVYHGTTGQLVQTIVLNSSPGAFINDVIVTREAVYFSDSFLDVFYRVPLMNNGRLPDPPSVNEIQLTGDFTFLPGNFNGNGIVATPDGAKLIIGNSATGILYLVDPLTGVADEIDLGGDLVPNNDGLVLNGKTLYVVQNFDEQISQIELSSDFLSGEIVRVITHPDFRIPATAALFGSMVYAVNARFDVSPPPVFGGDPTGIEYEIVGVNKN